MNDSSTATLSGRVIPGDGRGRTLGFPTANLELEPSQLPEDGIYAAWVRIDDDPRPWAATVSVGTNPTFLGDRARRVEVHLHDIERDLYGCTLGVVLVAFLRPTLCFENPDRLVAQSALDVAHSAAALRG